MQYWLLKSEPNTFSWDDLVKKGQDHWDGVRNYLARNNMKAMRKGDLGLFYHSVNEKCVVGIVEIVKEHYPDPTIKDDRWVVVDVKPIKKLKRTVTLEEIKADPRFDKMVLVNNTRLSVQPVSREEFDLILALSEA